MVLPPTVIWWSGRRTGHKVVQFQSRVVCSDIITWIIALKIIIPILRFIALHLRAPCDFLAFAPKYCHLSLCFLYIIHMYAHQSTNRANVGRKINSHSFYRSSRPLFDRFVSFDHPAIKRVVKNINKYCFWSVQGWAVPLRCSLSLWNSS